MMGKMRASSLPGFGRGFTQLAYPSFYEFLEPTFGYAARVAHERLRVAPALEGLPELRRELAVGRLHWSAAAS